MKTILKTEENELIIKNSKFICYLIPLHNNNIKDLLENIKKIHPKANHYCYGYIYDNERYSSDDNEPTNTAGLPILNVLEKEQLNHILAIVVRYFGGIKLGAGGLVRAYTKSVSETIKKIQKIELIPGYIISITFSYEEEKAIKYIIQKSKIIEETYQEKITYKLEIDENIYQKLIKYNPTIIEKTFIMINDSNLS